MLNAVATLFDPLAFAIVFGGTMFATLMRCGWRDLVTAGDALGHLLSGNFDQSNSRASLARAVSEIRERGHLIANPDPPRDRGFSRILEIYLKTGSTHILNSAAQAQHAERMAKRTSAQRVFDQAGELAPVFGLVGTLFAIAQLTPEPSTSAAETAMASVATAVLSSLYGVLSAHLLYHPIARAIERNGKREDSERTALVEWFMREMKHDEDDTISKVRETA